MESRRWKLIGSLTVFAIIAGGTCADKEPKKRNDKPTCLKLQTPKAGGVQATQQECRR